MRRRNLCSPLETRLAFEMLTHQPAQLLRFSLLGETVLSEIIQKGKRKAELE